MFEPGWIVLHTTFFLFFIFFRQWKRWKVGLGFLGHFGVILRGGSRGLFSGLFGVRAKRVIFGVFWGFYRFWSFYHFFLFLFFFIFIFFYFFLFFFIFFYFFLFFFIFFCFFYFFLFFFIFFYFFLFFFIFFYFFLFFFIFFYFFFCGVREWVRVSTEFFWGGVVCVTWRRWSCPRVCRSERWVWCVSEYIYIYIYISAFRFFFECHAPRGENIFFLCTPLVCVQKFLFFFIFFYFFLFFLVSGVEKNFFLCRLWKKSDQSVNFYFFSCTVVYMSVQSEWSGEIFIFFSGVCILWEWSECNKSFFLWI